MQQSNLFSKGIKILFYVFLGYFGYLMVLITLQYIPINFDVAFLRIKQDEISKTHYQVAFFMHVYTSIFVLFLGMPQFSARIRIRLKSFHRLTGKLYVGIILVLAAPSGLILGYYANGGIIAQLGFLVLALLWFYFIYLAYVYARKKEFDKHRKFMLRSYALTLSAISLRLLKLGIVHIWELPPMDITRIIAWGGWLLNLLTLEFVMWFLKKRKQQITRN